ncbi:copper homeostasis protein CutC [Spirosoma taeanense]|uniref:PF03932 family protein CutC n=1 Tax=Spirosoma taeanense TaxID=2735870 RepID=A0A6M5YET5_9BACT|nr:copper homeostasis protein CutC [Spirosoma taeanense]QJW91830.1 copper homeostasis protein CutC [Spirosoma taeanense]
MLVEVCAYSLDSCLTAQEAGAGRIELCGGLSEGGITPSAGLIRIARQHLTIPLYVMIRPRGGDFVYTPSELAVMRADIESAKSLGADGLVFGILRPDGTVDEAQTRQLIELAYPLPVTFHRAFDMTRDPLEALEAVIRTGAARILTSGQQPTAEAGLPVLQQLVQQAAGRIEIMAGAGVNAGNARQIRKTRVDALHLSGRQSLPSPMIYRNPGLSMASVVPDEYERIEAGTDAIRQVIKSLSADQLPENSI